MRIAVLGTGLIGGSVGLAASARVAGAEVAGYDPDAGALAAANDRGAIDAAAGSVGEAVAGASACFCCAPVGVLADLAREALAAAPADCVVSDVGSTKRAIAAASDDERFVPGHPVAGAETAGIEHARADLFEGATWYLTPREHASGLLYERLHRLVAGLGAHPVAIEPDAHDRLLAAVSHLPHVLANVLVSRVAGLVEAESEAAVPRVGPSFRDATRVAGANPAIWRDIYASNASAIAAEIDAAVEALRGVADSLRAGDAEAIAAWGDAARADRVRVLEAELVGGPARELRLTVPNRPGIVAQVALALGRAGVNIADMALAPAADMSSGAMTLWVAGDKTAARARELIEELGFPVEVAA
jgi:prephenate dehydrogenase